MDNMKELVGQTITAIEEVVKMFYQQRTQEAYTQLDLVLGKLLSTIETVMAYQQEHTEIEIDIDGLTDALKEALSAMEEKDAILVADVLQYEVIEKLEAIASLL